jgi:2-keto-3-deoxy-galactonokinase
MNSLIGKYLQLKKEEDLVFKGNHPNFINVGNKEIKGFCVKEPVVGEQFYLYPSKKMHFRPSSWTSKVVSVDTENQKITTENSVYSYTIITQENEDNIS